MYVDLEVPLREGRDQGARLTVLKDEPEPMGAAKRSTDGGSIPMQNPSRSRLFKRCLERRRVLRYAFHPTPEQRYRAIGYR